MGSRDRSRSRERVERTKHREGDRDRNRDRDRRDRSRDRERRSVKQEDSSSSSGRREDRRPKREQELGEPRTIKPEGGGFSRGPEDEEEEVEKQGPNFEVSGKLAEDTNTFKGVVIKYSEPPEAKKPKKRWRFYVFKGEEEFPILHIHRQSAFLMGKDRKIADLPIDHPSCSRQHAVLQYRMLKRDGANRVLPYIIDLGSSNGTFLNNKKIEAKKYHELREKDVLKFGYSSREYVLLHDNSKDSDSD